MSVKTRTIYQEEYQHGSCGRHRPRDHQLVVAVLEGGDPVVVANSEGSRTTPSVVAFARNGEVLVGQPAKNQAVTNVDRTIRSVKRHMGTDWSVEIDGKNYTAQEISARVLHEAQARRGELPR